MSSIFGSSSFAKPAATGFGSFLNTNTNTQPAGNTAGGGLFGGFGASNNQNQQQTAGATPAFGGASNTTGTSLFGGGSGATQPTGGSLFGNATNNTNNQPATTGGSLFGGGTNTTGTGLFGSTNTQPTAGGTPAGSTLFGTANTANTTLPATNTNVGSTAGGGLFGNTASNTTTQNTQPAFGGSLFGQQNQQQGNTTTGNTVNPLFGGSTTTQTQPTTSLFGQSNTQQQPSTSLFGQTNQQQQQPATSLFGQSTQQQQPTTSLFGQPAQQQQPQQSSLFGNTGTSNITGTTGGTGFGLFGNTSTSTQPTSNIGFGLQQPAASTATNLFGSKSVAGIVQTPQHDDTAQAQFQNLLQRVEGLARAWDPNSPQCRFQHYFYNLVDPNQVHLYGRPANATNDALWQKAVRENPDPKCYVPVVAFGFDDLQKRVEAQKQQSMAHLEKIKELHSRIKALSDSHTLTDAPRIQRLTALQSQLNQRLTRLAQHLHLLIPAMRSSSIRPEEEALRASLEELEVEIKRPGGTGSGRQKGKLNELWALIGVLQAAKERERSSDGGKTEWTVVDQEGLQRIAQILREEQNGIAHLTKIIEGHTKDLDIIYGKPRSETNMDTDPFNTAQARQVLLGTSVR